MLQQPERQPSRVFPELPVGERILSASHRDPIRILLCIALDLFQYIQKTTSFSFSATRFCNIFRY
jgi:hypothetical protein